MIKRCVDPNEEDKTLGMKSLGFRRAATMLAFAATFALGVSPEVAAKRIKCWTNDEGVRECGNFVPPKYSQQGHREIGKHGLTVSSQKRAKTQAEVDAEREASRKKKEREKREAQLAREQATRDRVLVDTFTTEEDLHLAHQGRLAAIDSRVKHTRQLIDGLKVDLSNLRKQAAREERSGKAVPDTLSKRISGNTQQISQHLNFIAERQAKKAELELQFQKDLARYRHLKGTSN